MIAGMEWIKYLAALLDYHVIGWRTHLKPLRPGAEPLIRPRTKDERRAYMAGYADAINSTDDHGLETARAFLHTMVETEAVIDIELAEVESVRREL